MILDPINAIENADLSEVQCCRHCRECIEPGTDQEWNGWAWHRDCLPAHVYFGREQEARDDEAKHEW
jgi:hypothetical protein